MRKKDLKVGSLYQTYASGSSFIVRHGYLRTIPGRSRGKRFIIYLGEADPADLRNRRPHYFWVLVGNEKCLMHSDRLREIKPVEET